jgi:lysophospholipase L1-like esterase
MRAKKLINEGILLLCVVLLLSAVISNNASAQAVAAYSADTTGSCLSSGSSSGINIGHSFYIAATNLQVLSLGVADCGGDGLLSSHTVTMFTYNGSSFVPVPGCSLSVPAGTSAPLLGGYRYQTLPSPVYLPAGFYAVIAYQMNGGANSDPYIQDNGNNGFNGSGVIFDHQNYYDNVTNSSPSFPASDESGQNFGSASFTYVLGAVQTTFAPGVPAISPSAVVVNAGQTVTLTVSDPTGTLPINYQWYYGTNFVPISGATNGTLVLPNAQPVQSVGNAGVYSVAAQNPYGGPVFNAATNQAVIKVNPVIKIMPLGDSITDGKRGEDIGGYRGPLYQLLADSNYNFSYVGSQSDNDPPWLPYPNHDGVPSSVITGVSAGIYSVTGGYTNSWAQAYTPDVILLLIGTNDYGTGNGDGATNRLDALVSEIFTNLPNVKLFLANLTLRTDNPSLEASIESTYNPFIPVIVSNHFALGQQVYFVDLHSALGASDISDGLHPNDSGYNKMAVKWFQAIENVIQPPAHPAPTLNVTKTNSSFGFTGVSGFQYIVQRTTNLFNGDWVSICTNTMPTNGLAQITDSFPDLGGIPPANALYRTQLVLY